MDRNLLESMYTKAGGAATFIFIQENLLSSVFSLLIGWKAVWSAGPGSPEAVMRAPARSTPTPGR